jgi:acyl-CoA reductase-like NAD-dependent aldehyde dehydrogenase
MSEALPHRGTLDMGRGHDAIACDAAKIYVRPGRGRSRYLETTNCVTTTTFSAGAADVTFSETRSGLAGPVRVLHEPLGVVVAIVPWEDRC